MAESERMAANVKPKMGLGQCRDTLLYHTDYHSLYCQHINNNCIHHHQHHHHNYLR